MTVEYDEDKIFDPMIYDVMRELATQVHGIYQAHLHAAKTQADRDYWFQKTVQLRSDVRQVDPGSKIAIEKKMAQLELLLDSLQKSSSEVIAV